MNLCSKCETHIPKGALIDNPEKEHADNKGPSRSFCGEATTNTFDEQQNRDGVYTNHQERAPSSLFDKWEGCCAGQQHECYEDDRDSEEILNLNDGEKIGNEA